MTISEMEGRLLNELRAITKDDHAWWQSRHYTQCGDKIIRGPHVGVYIRRRGRTPTKALKRDVAQILNKCYAKVTAFHPTTSTKFQDEIWWTFDVSIVKPRHWAEPKPL